MGGDVVLEGGAGDVERAHRGKLDEIEGWHSSAGAAEEDHRAAGAEDFEGLVEGGLAYGVVDGVEAWTVGDFFYFGGKVFLCVEDDLVGTGVAGERCLLLGRDGGEDAGAERLRHLNKKETGAAGPGVDEDFIARPYGVGGVGEVVGGHALQDGGRSLLGGDALWNRDKAGGRGHCELGVGAGDAAPCDAITCFDDGDVGAEGDDGACGLLTQDVGEVSGIAAFAEVRVDEIDAGGFDADEGFAGTGFGCWDVAEGEDFWASGGEDLNGLHSGCCLPDTACLSIVTVCADLEEHHGHSYPLAMLFRSLLLTFALTCGLCAQNNPAWTKPVPPYRVIGNIYYVGSEDLASYLITTPQGHILINSSLQSSVPLIRKSVEELGFHFRDVKILLISHAHFDHCAGSALIKRLTGARYMVMDAAVPVVESGGRRDFQYGGSASMLYPAAKVDHVLHDGDEVRLGDAVLVAHVTPGHTKGCTTWTMKVDEGGKSYNVVIVGSPNVNTGYKLVGNKRYPQIAQDYALTFRTLKALPCDVFLGAHGSYFGMASKIARMKEGGANPFIDPDGYRSYVSEREQVFRAELAKQTPAQR